MNNVIDTLESVLNENYPPRINKKIPNSFTSIEQYYACFKPFILREMYTDIHHTKTTRIQPDELQTLDVIKYRSKFVVVSDATLFKKHDCVNYVSSIASYYRIFSVCVNASHNENDVVNSILNEVSCGVSKSNLPVYDAIKDWSKSPNGPLMLIQGPPGTGKTHLITEMLYLFPSKYPILVCAPSNKAVSNILLKLKPKMSEVIVYGSLENIDNDIHSFSYEIRKAHLESNTMVWAASNDYLHMTPSEQSTIYSEIIEPYMKKYNFNSIEQVQSFLNDEHAVINENKVRFVLCTVSSANISALKNQKFDFAVVDEACQCKEAETLIILNKNLRHLVLVGDPKQLPATVKDNCCRSMGFDRSLLDRLYRNKLRVYMLRIQYRMHPEIAAFPSTFFYNGKLQNGRHFGKTGQPYMVVQMGLTAEEKTEDKSLLNREEADYIIAMVKQMHTANTSIDFGIITPYMAQKNYIASLLDIDRVSIGTVDSFQGQERDVVLLSMVRTHKFESVGFLNDTRRLNVALTRARYKLVVVGDIQFLATKTDIWKNLYNDSVKRGVIKYARNVLKN